MLKLCMFHFDDLNCKAKKELGQREFCVISKDRIDIERISDEFMCVCVIILRLKLDSALKKIDLKVDVGQVNMKME